MEKTLGFYDGIKAIIGTIAVFVIGAALITWPKMLDLFHPSSREGFPTDIPYHTEIGYGFIVLGVLMLLSRFNLRAKALLAVFASSSLAAVSIWAATSLAFEGWQVLVAWALAAVFTFSALLYLKDLITGRDIEKIDP